MTEGKQFLDITPEQLADYRNKLTECVKLGEALQRLEMNQDFIDLFIEGYCKDEAVRNVHLFSDHSYYAGKVKQDVQAELLDSIVAISKFSEYRRFINQRAMQCKSELASILEEETKFYSN